MKTHQPILLATTNPAKQEKLRWLVEGLPLTPITPSDVGLDSSAAPEETGSSHGEIAFFKAMAWSRASSMTAICSDGGLVIPSLGLGWQSVLTHRFAGEGSDNDRTRRLLDLMAPYLGEDRKAHWIEALAIADGERVLGCWEVEGATGYLERTTGPPPAIQGFWAHSIWYIPELGKRYAELDENELSKVHDHWTQLKSLLRDFLQESLGPL